MTGWKHLPVEVRELAEAALTEKQLDAWALQLAGLSHKKIALALGISRRAVTDRLEHVHRKLEDLGVVEDARGHWDIRRAA